MACFKCALVFTKPVNQFFVNSNAMSLLKAFTISVFKSYLRIKRGLNVN